jgi:hypothetical protein
MRDVSVIRNSSGALFIYTVMDYGRVLEYRPLNVQQNTWRCVENTLPNPFLTRVAAATSGGTKVLVAVGQQAYSATAGDAKPPTRKDGFWSDNCLAYGGIEDPNAPPQSSGVDAMSFFTKDTATASAPLTPLGPPNSFAKWWKSLSIRHVSGDVFRVYASSTEQPTEVWIVLNQVTEGFSPTPTIGKLAVHVPEGTVQTTARSR